MDTVSGKWLINEDPFYSFPAAHSEITEMVNFSINGVPYSQISLYKSNGTSIINARVIWGEVSSTLYQYNPNIEAFYGWMLSGNEHRTFDFGSEEQTVSPVFTQWLEANATEIHDDPDDPETPPEALYGTWQWMDSGITTPTQEFYNDITFTNDSGDKFYSLKVDKNSSEEWVIVYGNEIVYNFNTEQWLGQKYRILNFGTTANPTYVSAAFYSWFTYNASKVQIIVKSGTWTFDDVINRPDLRFAELEVGRFISNHKIFNKIWIPGDYNEIYYDDVLVYNDLAGWVDPEYKHVYFENDLVSISETLWDTYLETNVTTNNDKPTIRGVWNFDDAVDVKSNLEQVVKFKVVDGLYDYLTVSGAKILCDNKVVYENGWVGGPKNKQFDFGTDIQTIEKKFLFWLIDNAEKVSLYLIDEITLTGIADAVRFVSSKTSHVAADKIAAKDLAEAIRNIEVPVSFTDEEIDAIMEAAFSTTENVTLNEEEMNE